MQCDLEVARTGKAFFTFFAVLQTTHQGKPLQPLAIEEIPDRRNALQDEANIVFLAVMEALGNEGEIIQSRQKADIARASSSDFFPS